MDYSEINKIDSNNQNCLEVILDSVNLIEKIFIYSEKYYEEKNIYGNILKLKDNIDKYIIDLISNNILFNQDLRRINNYFRVLNKIIDLNPSIVFSHPIFKLDTNIILKYISMERYSEIRKKVLQYNDEARNIYDKFMKNENSINKEEYKKLINFMINSIDSSISNIDIIHKNLIFKLFNSNKSHSDLRTKYFILKYLVHKKTQQLKFKANLYFCDSFSNKKIHELGKKVNFDLIINASAFRNTKLNDMKILDFDNMSITKMQEYSEKGYNVFVMLYTLFHEIEHVKQDDDLLNDKVTLRTIENIEYIFFEKYLEYNDYNKNYKFYDLEISANEQAYTEIISFIETFVPKKLYSLRSSSTKLRLFEARKRSYAYKKDSKNEKILSELYTVSKLNEIISSHPEELKTFACLKEFYNDSGLLKNLDELLLKKMKYKFIGEEDNVFDKFIIYCVASNKLEKINLINYDDSNKMNILYALEDILSNQISALFDINREYDSNFEVQKFGYNIVITKINIIQNIFNFFNKNEFVQTEDLKNYIKRDYTRLVKIIGLLEIKFKTNIFNRYEGDKLNEFRHK